MFVQRISGAIGRKALKALLVAVDRAGATLWGSWSFPYLHTSSCSGPGGDAKIDSIVDLNQSEKALIDDRERRPRPQVPRLAPSLV